MGASRGRLRVVVADDDDRVRSAVVDLLSDDDRLAVVGSVADGDALVAAAVDLRADVVLMDVRMPSGGAEALRRVRGAQPDAVVVALSAHADATSVEALLEAGAAGYLTKGEVGAELPDLVLRCAAGERVLSPSARRSTASRQEAVER